jgi:thiamine-phosphate pyrophosphorylase
MATSLADRLRLMVITDRTLLRGRDPVAVCRAAVRGGATMIQVRDKETPPRDLLTVVRFLVAALPVPVLVNDRVDVALAAGAAGAHLGQDDVPIGAVRPHVPAGFILGTSVGSVGEADRARVESADYWSIGPCFSTATKPDAGAPLGPAGFAALARLAPPAMPVIGIGGIGAANAPLILRAGAAGVAVIAAVLAAEDPESAARALVFPAPAPSPGGSPPGAPRS